MRRFVIFYTFMLLPQFFLFAGDTVFTAPVLKNNIAIIGTDDRLSSGAKPSDAEHVKYAAVGYISCDKEGATSSDNYVSTGTATVVENNQTVITSAHTFFNKSGGLITKLSLCRFNLFDQNGKLTQSIKIADMIAPSDTSGPNLGAPSSDSTDAAKNTQNDWVIIKLAEPARNVAPFAVSRTSIVNLNDKMKLCAYHNDLSDLFVKRCLQGTYKHNGADSMKHQNPMMLFHDIDLSGGASGGPLFVERNSVPTVFALQIGQISLEKNGRCAEDVKDYNLERCSNYGVFFTKNFYKALDTIVNETGGSIYAPPTARPANFIREKPPERKDRGVST